jgi:hypothetical protein
MTIKHFSMQSVYLLIAAAVVFFLLVPADGQGGQADPVDQTIQYLIARVARSDLTFIRNSEHHTGQQASEHMQKKYEHFRSEIKTPEDFIDLCASRSLLTGKPYLVINEQGETIRTSDWLVAALREYRNSTPGQAR